MNATTGSLMSADMAEQPAVLELLLGERTKVHDAVRRIAPQPLRGIALVGRGSSGNAALFGHVPLTLATGSPVLALPPSMARLYGTCGRLRGFLVIGLTQSGGTFEIEQTLKRCVEDDAVTMVVTADPHGSVAWYADLVLDLHTGIERAIPATKTFTAEIATLAMIAEAFDPTPAEAADWRRVIDHVAAILDDTDALRRAATIVGEASQLSVIASGASFAIAKEAALKILEASGIAAAAWSAEEFRHGPIAIAGPDHPVVAISPCDADHGDVRRTLAMIPDVPSIVIADAAEADVALPSGLPETLAAIPAAVRAQQLALALARRRHVDADRPQRLTKVVNA